MLLVDSTISSPSTRRLERSLNETREELTAAHSHLRETSAARDEAKTVGAAASAKLQASEEQLLRAKREKDLLQAERSVWQVARSGIQEELAKVQRRELWCVQKVAFVDLRAGPALRSPALTWSASVFHIYCHVLRKLLSDQKVASRTDVRPAAL